MSFKRYQYALPRRSSGNELIESLRGEGLNLRPQSPVGVERVFFDSFDWRLYAAGLLLFVDHAGDRRRLTLRSLEEGLDVVSADVDDDPCFAADLPDGVLRRRVAPLLASRRLLDRARLKARFRYLHVLDDEDKTVARLCIEQHQVFREDGRLRRLRDRIAVIPVRGYDDWLARLRAIFEEALASDRIQAPALDEALTALGRRPLDYSAKPAPDLDPQMPAGHAARAIFSELLAVIEANEDGVRHDYDIEFLHDLRVATRRTRTLLGQMKKVLPGPQFMHYRNEFAWLGAMTGPVRDLDVHLLEFPRYAALAAPASDEKADGEAADDLAPLLALLRRRRALERRNLLAVLASPRYRNLKRGWKTLLDDASAEAWTDGAAGFPVSAAMPAIMRHRHEKALKRGRQIDAEAPDTAFHEMRTECKKLRYLMEFFAGQFPRDEIRPLIKALKGLQDNLGEYQDLCVQRAMLAQSLEEWPADAADASPTAVAIMRVIDGMDARRREVHAAFADAFRRFAAVSEHKHIESLYRHERMAESA